MSDEYGNMLSHLEAIQTEINGLRKKMKDGPKPTVQTPKPTVQTPESDVEAPKPQPVVPKIPAKSHGDCKNLGCPAPKCKPLTKKEKRNKKIQKEPCNNIPGCVLAAPGEHGNNKSWSACRALNPPPQGGRKKRTRRSIPAQRPTL